MGGEGGEGKWLKFESVHIGMTEPHHVPLPRPSRPPGRSGYVGVNVGVGEDEGVGVDVEKWMKM